MHAGKLGQVTKFTVVGGIAMPGGLHARFCSSRCGVAIIIDSGDVKPDSESAAVDCSSAA